MKIVGSLVVVKYQVTLTADQRAVLIDAEELDPQTGLTHLFTWERIVKFADILGLSKEAVKTAMTNAPPELLS